MPYEINKATDGSYVIRAYNDEVDQGKLIVVPYPDPRKVLLNWIGQAHLLPGMNSQKLIDAYDKFLPGVKKMEDVSNRHAIISLGLYIWDLTWPNRRQATGLARKPIMWRKAAWAIKELKQ